MTFITGKSELGCRYVICIGLSDGISACRDCGSSLSTHPSVHTRAAQVHITFLSTHPKRSDATINVLHLNIVQPM